MLAFEALGNLIVPEPGKKEIEVEDDWCRKIVAVMLGIDTRVQIPDIENDIFDYVRPKLGPNNSALAIVEWTLGAECTPIRDRKGSMGS